MRGPGSIVIDYNLNDPPAEVWRALTEPRLLAQWLMRILAEAKQPVAS